MKRKLKPHMKEVNMPRVIGEVEATDSTSARNIAKEVYSEYVIDAVYLTYPSARVFKGMKTWTVDGHTRMR